MAIDLCTQIQGVPLQNFAHSCVYWKRFLDAGIQDVSTSILIINDKTEMSDENDDDGDESDKHM